MRDNHFSNELIHGYSRAQALADGVLIDATELSRQAGFRWPVALTGGAWAATVAAPPGVGGVDERSRLIAVLIAMRQAVLAAPGGNEARFTVLVRQDNSDAAPLSLELRAVLGPGDQGEPVLTVMLPEED